MWWLIALVAVVAWISTPPSAQRVLRRLRVVEPERRPGLAVSAPMLLAASAGLFVWQLSSRPGFGIAVTVTTATSYRLIAATRRRKAAKARATEVARSANLLSTLLRSGQIPVTALHAAAQDFPVLRPASAVAKLGGDVAAALQREAASDGGAGLRTISAAWSVSERSGAPISAVLARVAQTLREEHRIQEVIDAELATARVSGQMMALLPLGAVALGWFAGVNTLDFLAHHWLGQWLIAAAVSITALGVLWIDRLATP